MKRTKIISCIGTSYIQPIYDLYEKISSHTFTGDNKIKKSMNENGYSCSIILLAVLMIESVLIRVKYFSYNKSKTKIGYSFFEKKFGKSPMSKELKEIYIIRNVIAHNHLWGVSFEYGQKYEFTKIYSRWIKKSLGAYDLPEDAVDLRKRKTNLLKMNINPLQIGISDMRKVLRVVRDVLYFMDSQRVKGAIGLLSDSFQYKSSFLSFDDFVKRKVEPFL